MYTAKFLSKRLREVFLDGLWVANTNYKTLIEDLDWQQATKSIESRNSIAALVFHVNYYLKGILDAFESGKLTISDKYSFDLPPINSESDWQALIKQFLNNANLFAAAVENMSEEEINGPFIDEKYGSYLRNLEGVIEHSYYHMGQIAMLKKIILQSQAT